MPAVSILMPVRNGAETLERALQSIRSQTMDDWELVVVDDGSSDETPRILADHAAGDRRIRPVIQPPLGIARALQAGCDACRGGWIARMDADDWMHPERLASQLAFAHRNPELAVVSCLVRYGGAAAGYSAHVDWLNALVSPESIALRRFVESPVAHPSVMFRRDLIEKHGGYRDGDFPEDYELWLRWMDAGVRFGKVPRELLEWSDPPGRLSRTDPRYSVENFYQTKCFFLARWLCANLDARRKLWLWGAGRVTRRRFDALEKEGFRFEGFIDVDPRKKNEHRDGRRVVIADELQERGSAFIIVGVGNRGARERIEAHLLERGWIEGRDFLFAA